MELQEAAQIHQGLLHNRQNSLHDMKAIVKTWRNRLPVISDDLSHWSDIFTWRQHHYQFIANHYNNTEQAEQSGSHSMLGVHASAQAIIHFGKIARKHNLTGVCLESLSRIYTIASVPIVDCFQKIRQQVKCYVQTAATLGKNELQEGLDIIESTKLKYFTKEMTAEFYALKGTPPFCRWLHLSDMLTWSVPFLGPLFNATETKQNLAIRKPKTFNPLLISTEARKDFLSQFKNPPFP